MNQVVADGHREVIDLNNNSDGLGKVDLFLMLLWKRKKSFLMLWKMFLM
nr:hypothetical protein [Wolbachia endosymbiont of Bemisia tabaci]